VAIRLNSGISLLSHNSFQRISTPQGSPQIAAGFLLKDLGLQLPGTKMRLRTGPPCLLGMGARTVRQTISRRFILPLYLPSPFGVRFDPTILDGITWWNGNSTMYFGRLSSAVSLHYAQP